MPYLRLSVCFVVALVAGCNKPASAPTQSYELDITDADREGLHGPMPEHLRQPAIPQDQVRMKHLRAERLARARSSTIEAYKKVGRTDAKWDAAAEAALEKVAIAKANDDRDVDAAEAAWEALTKAIELGCDDPYVRYVHFNYTRAFERSAGDKKEIARVARALRDSNYPAVRRAHAAYNFALADAPEPTTLAQVEEAIKSESFVAIFDLLRKALEDDVHGATDDFVVLFNLMGGYFAKVRGTHELVYAAFRDTLGDAPELESVRLWLKGKYHTQRGWDARGHDWASRVPRANMETFQNELETAAAAFQEAWRLDPSRAEVAIGMMCAVGPFAEHAQVEEWFQKAMSADGDCVAACQPKANFLAAKWGGHVEAIRQFAARLAETKNWHAGLPFEGAEILAGLSQGKSNLLARVGKDWPAVEGVYTDFLAVRPDSRWGWSSLAKLASDTGHFKVALNACEKVNGNPSRAIFTKEEFDKCMKLADLIVKSGGD